MTRGCRTRRGRAIRRRPPPSPGPCHPSPCGRSARIRPPARAAMRGGALGLGGGGEARPGHADTRPGRPGRGGLAPRPRPDGPCPPRRLGCPALVRRAETEARGPGDPPLPRRRARRRRAPGSARSAKARPHRCVTRKRPAPARHGPPAAAPPAGAPPPQPPARRGALRGRLVRRRAATPCRGVSAPGRVRARKQDTGIGGPGVAPKPAAPRGPALARRASPHGMAAALAAPPARTRPHIGARALGGRTRARAAERRRRVSARATVAPAGLRRPGRPPRSAASPAAGPQGAGR
jgi:hypothetical protein